VSRRARPAFAIGRNLFLRLLATHLLASAGVLVIAILITADRIDTAWAIILSFAVLGGLIVALTAVITRGVTYPLDRIHGEIERATGGTVAIGSQPGESRALVTAVNRLAGDLAGRVDELRAETALREQVLSSMDEAVLLAEGADVVYANPAARDLFEISDLRTLPPVVPIPEDPLPVTKEFSLHHPTYREVRCTSARVADGKILVVAQDVTEAKRTERVRRDFVANASHELKTPVAGILATAETLQDAMTHDPNAAARFAETLTKEATRLSNLVQDLLSLARLEQTLRVPEPVNLSAIVERVAAEMRPDAAGKKIDLQEEVETSVVVSGGPEDLTVLVRNLLDNAIRYTPEGGKVTVTLRRGAGRADLVVRDTGIGIPARDVPRIFERFYRVDKARSRVTGGTGLGLSIVRHVAENHGGAVTAQSELGVGSTFTVTLPLTG